MRKLRSLIDQDKKKAIFEEDAKAIKVNEKLKGKGILKGSANERKGATVNFYGSSGGKAPDDIMNLKTP